MDFLALTYCVLDYERIHYNINNVSVTAILYFKMAAI